MGETEDSIHTWNDKGITLGKLEKHEEFGHVQIKTEIHELDTTIPNTIYDVS